MSVDWFFSRFVLSGVEDKTVEFLGFSKTFNFILRNSRQSEAALAPQTWKNCVTLHGTSKNQGFLDHPWKFQFFFN